MKTAVVCLVALCGTAHELPAQRIRVVERTFVNDKPEAKIVLAADSTIVSISLNAAKFALVANSGERVYANRIQILPRRISLVFPVNADNFVAFERLVSDSSGYYIRNDEDVLLSNGAVNTGELVFMTKDSIRTIPRRSWNAYVLNEYAASYLYPQRLNFGTQLGIEGATQTVYYLELFHSGIWTNARDISYVWGLKGRWSTDKNDRFSYAKIYPFSLVVNQTSWRLGASTGIETGNRGFTEQGRGVLKTEAQFRLPFNPVNLTLGNPRWRINPAVNISFQGNIGWSNASLPDSLARSVDATLSLRYDIPVGKNYYLQTQADGNYSSATREIQYQYDLSLGYIVDGTIRLVTQFRQGYQEGTYQFDRQLFLGFAIDVLNESVVR